MIDDVVDHMWAEASKVLFVTKEEFVKDLQTWDIEPVEIDGVLAFATLRKGPNFHFHSFGTGRRLTRKMIEDFLRPIIDLYGYAATKTPKDDERQQRFNIAFGFQFAGEDEYDVHYRIERLRSARTH